MRTHAGDTGTGTFIRQRLTAIINIPLILFFVWLVVGLARSDRAEMAAAFTNPVVAVLALALLTSALIHMRIGMHEVIADYVHDPRLYGLCNLLNTAFTVAIGAVAAISVIVLAFGG